VLETEPQLIEQSIKSGRAQLVYRHLLQLGDATQRLAEASECAGAQGKFWEMREAIYRNQGALYRATDAALQPLVDELGLDGAPFNQCLASKQFQQQVKDDFAAAEREGVRSRPVLDINGTRIIGAQPLAEYQQAIAAAE
jgi:protein-disulfide isomerase